MESEDTLWHINYGQLDNIAEHLLDIVGIPTFNSEVTIENFTFDGYFLSVSYQIEDKSSGGEITHKTITVGMRES